MGISISPRYKTVTVGTRISFTVSGSGFRPADYRVIFRAEGVKKFEKWFEGPSTFSYSASHTFNNVGSIALKATLTEFPAMITETATGTITVTKEEEVATRLTIFAPSAAGEGEAFTISGKLTRQDTGAALPGRTIRLSRDGVSLGSDTTDAYGRYSKSASIPTSGLYTLKASFPGNPGLAPSNASMRVGLRAKLF